MKKITIMDTNTIIGIVTEALPNTMFRVRVPKHTKKIEPIQEKNSQENPEENSKEISNEPQFEIIIAYLGGKMKFNRIRVIVGDIVELVTDEYGGKARIVRRKAQHSN